VGGAGARARARVTLRRRQPRPMSRRLGLLLAVAVSSGMVATAAAVAFAPGSARIVDERVVLRFAPSPIPPVDVLALAPDGSRVAYRTSRDPLGLLDHVHDAGAGPARPDRPRRVRRRSERSLLTRRPSPR